MQELKLIQQKEPIVNDFFLYFPTRTLAKEAASEIKKKGFEVRVDKIENEFLCQALKNIIFTDISSVRDTIYEIEDILLEIAIKFQGRYDQWRSLGPGKGMKFSKLAKEFIKEPKKLREPSGIIDDTEKEEPSKMLNETQGKKEKSIEKSRLSVGLNVNWKKRVAKEWLWFICSVLVVLLVWIIILWSSQEGLEGLSFLTIVSVVLVYFIRLTVWAVKQLRSNETGNK